MTDPSQQQQGDQAQYQGAPPQHEPPAGFRGAPLQTPEQQPPVQQPPVQGEQPPVQPGSSPPGQDGQPPAQQPPPPARFNVSDDLFDAYNRTLTYQHQAYTAPQQPPGQEPASPEQPPVQPSAPPRQPAQPAYTPPGTDDRDMELTPQALENMIDMRVNKSLESFFERRDRLERQRRQKAERIAVLEREHQDAMNTFSDFRERAEASAGMKLPDEIIQQAVKDLHPFFNDQVKAGVPGASTARMQQILNNIKFHLKGWSGSIQDQRQLQQGTNQVNALLNEHQPAAAGAPPAQPQSFQRAAFADMQKLQHRRASDLIDGNS